MVVNSHTAVAIAEITFYVPAVPITLYLLVRNWKYRPRTAWYPPAAFSAIRLAGGIITIIEQKHRDSRGLFVATVLLLNIGLIPLLLALLGYARLVLEHDFKDNRKLMLFLRLLKILLLVAAGLLGAAGGFAAQPGFANTQSALSKAAYSLFVVVLVALIASYIGMAVNQSRVTPAHRLYIKLGLGAAFPLTVRAVYGILGVVLASGDNMFTSIWSPLLGNATAFALMALLPEYLVLCIYIYLSTCHLRSRRKQEVVEDGSKRRTRHNSDDMS